VEFPNIRAFPEEKQRLTIYPHKEHAITTHQPHDKKRSPHRKRDTLRSIAMRLNAIEENDRKRISRQLHDLVSQDLTAININLEMVISLLKEGKSAPSLHRLEDSTKLVRQAAEHLRDLMTVLRPPVLDDYGLLATLRWYAEQFSQRTALPVKVSGVEPFPELAPSLAMPLFRITQEALDNAARHAHASRVSIELVEEDRMIRLSITDDGTGFQPAPIVRPGETGGWGLWVIQQRTEGIGGKFTLNTQPGAGTQLTIELSR
jgi:signal transduction histidine kinase